MNFPLSPQIFIRRIVCLALCLFALATLNCCAESKTPVERGTYTPAESGAFPKDYKAIITKWYNSYGDGRTDGPGALGHLGAIGTPVRCTKADGQAGWKVNISEYGKTSVANVPSALPSGDPSGSDSIITRSSVTGSLDWQLILRGDEVVDYR